MSLPRTRLPAVAAATTLALALAACSGQGDGSGTSATPTESERPPAASSLASAPRDVPDPVADAAVDGPERADSPEQVVEQIVAAERAIQDPATGKKGLAAAGHLQQVAYRVLGNRPGWDRAVRRALPARLRPAVRRNVASRREFRSMHHELSDELPAWRIVQPAPAKELLAHYRLAERRFGVNWEYLAAINLVESGMGRIRGTSVAGAKGPMQFIPETWDRYGRGDIESPRDAILAAARYLAASGFDEPGGIPDALHSYNNHNAYVRGVTHLAKVMEEQPRAFFGYYHWQVYYLTQEGDVLLPVGYEQSDPVPVKRWLEDNPRE